MTAAAQDVDPAERVVRVAHHDLLLLPPLVECAPVQHHVVLESCIAGSESRTVEGSCRDEYGQRLPGARVCRERGAGSEHAWTTSSELYRSLGARRHARRCQPSAKPLTRALRGPTRWFRATRA